MTRNDFRPMIANKGDSFCVYLPEWNLSAEGKTIEEAYRAFEAQKIVLQQRSERFGLAMLAPEPYPQIKLRRIRDELAIFFAKIATAAFAVVFVIILLVPHVGAALKSQINPIPEGTFKHLAIEIPTKLNEKFDRPSPEEQRELVLQWGKLWRRTEPFREIFNDKRR